MGKYNIFYLFENPRRGMQARNFTTNVLKILDLKSSSENCRWVPLTQERLFEWNPIFSTWAILSFFSDSPTSCSLERWRWTTLKKSQTLLWEQIKRLETLSLQTTSLNAPREVHRLVLKKTSKVKKSRNKNQDQSELEAIFSCRFWVWENSWEMVVTLK